MARGILSLLVLSAVVAVAVAQVYPQAYPAVVPAATLPAAKGKVAALPKRPLAKVVRAPVHLRCLNTPAQDPQITVNCKVANLGANPVCINLLCNPLPPGICGPGTGGNGGQISGPPPDCGWNVINGCQSPQPVYPGQAWEFGWTTSQGRPRIVLDPRPGVGWFVANGTDCTHAQMGL